MNTSNQTQSCRGVDIHIYESGDNTVVKSVNPLLWLDRTQLQEISIEALFPQGSSWSSFSELYTEFKKYALYKLFCVAYDGKGKIHCNRAHRSKEKNGSKVNKRSFTNGPLRCGCQFHLKLSPTEYFSAKNGVVNKRKRPNFNEGNVIIKKFDYNHTNGCSPSILQYQFCASQIGEFISKIPISVYWQICSIMKNHPKNYVAPSTIKSSLSKCFPSYHNVTKQDIFNTRTRCKRLMNQFKDCAEFNTFEKSLNSDHQFLKQIELDKELDSDEAIEVMKEVFDTLFNNLGNSSSNNDIVHGNNQDYDSMSLKFQDYLELLSIKAKGFQYRLAIGNDNKINGVVWMTATMRSNFERFGSYLCLDAMKRELNTLNWPYFGISLYNELNSVCIGCESLMISERHDAYKFLINSCFEMCPGRTKSQVYIVSGDGFFCQDTLTNWGLSHAKFVCDYWHLFDSGLKDRFSPTYFNILLDNLKQMANSYDEQVLNRRYNEAKDCLKRYGLNNFTVLTELDKFYDERQSYAKYLVKQIPGNRNRRGSSCAEQNHSSVSSLMYNDKENKDYMEHAHVMIRDLFNRQKMHTNKFNRELYGLTNKRNIKCEYIESNKTNTKHYEILKAGLKHLNFNAFLLFEKEIQETINYETESGIEFNDDNFETCTVIKRIDLDAQPRNFFSIEQRCNCDFRVSHLMMCRHEIIFHNQFKISLFDVMHHYRPNVTMSYNIGPKVSYSNKTQLSTELIVAVDESVDGCTVDDLSQLFNLQYSIIDEPIDKTNPNKDVDTECNMENNKDDENNDIIEQCFNFESEESTAMNNIDSLSQEQSQNQHDYLPTKSIQSISNEIYNYYNRSDAYT